MMTLDHTINRIVDELASGGITGWCPIEKALDLAMTVVALRPKISMDIGVWGGRSCLPMALACEAVDNGVVLAIDPWSPQASAEGYSGVNADWWAQQDHERVYQDFLGHVKRLGLHNRVAIERAKSDAAAVPAVIDLLHIDSQHTEQAVREVRRFAVNVRVGGIVCMDDIEWANGDDRPVHRAIDALLALGFVELYRRTQPNGNWGMFQRVEKISLPAPAKHGLPSRRPAARGLAAPRRGAR